MKIAIVGCGFVADQYMSTLAHRRELELVAAHDRDPERTRAFSEHYRVTGHESLEALLADERVEIVLNLTNPRSHYEVTRRCLEAGKHVYSEKPLAMDVASAEQLLALAEQKGLKLAGAPCNVLGRTAQTVWKALENGVIGKPLLVYAAFEAGLIAPHERPWSWKSRTGAFWPAKDEFEIGCTFEHAGYLLTCLLAMFGPAKAVTAHAACLVKDKGIAVDSMAPDFSVGCVEFERNEVIARVTCGLLAPREKTFMVVGERGVLSVDTFRDDMANVYVRQHRQGSALSPAETFMEELRRRLAALLPWLPWGAQPFHFRRRYPFAVAPPPRIVNRKKRVDFSLGPLELAAAIRERRACRLDGRVGVHVVELINALQYPDPTRGKQMILTRFDRIEPLAWS
jgi:predicted dehydrogenase